MEIKDTLTMPKTGFEMRGNLPNKEPKFLERWQQENLYAKMMEKNENKQRFMLHDGPPYANGNIHLGHALNKILKDNDLTLLFASKSCNDGGDKKNPRNTTTRYFTRIFFATQRGKNLSFSYIIYFTFLVFHTMHAVHFSTAVFFFD